MHGNGEGRGGKKGLNRGRERYGRESFKVEEVGIKVEENIAMAEEEVWKEKTVGDNIQ